MKNILLVLLISVMPGMAYAEWLPPLTIPSVNTVDSTNVKDGSISVSDIANGANGFTRKTALDDSLLNYGVSPRLNAKTWFNLRPAVGAYDTAFSIRSSLGNTVAFVDSSGKFYSKVTLADEFKTTTAVKWGLSVTSFLFAATDSSGAFTTYTAAHDTSITRARNRDYIDFTHVNSNTEHKIVLGMTIPFLVTTNPDSVMFDIHGNAGADSLKFRLRVKSVLAAASSLYDSGWKSVTLMDTWTHNAAVMPAFTRNEDYEVLIEVRAKNNARGIVSAIQFK